MTETLSLGKTVLKQLKVNEPKIQKFFAKSDHSAVNTGTIPTL